MASFEVNPGDVNESLTAFAFETITVSTTAIGPTAATAAGAKAALVTNGATNDLTFRMDGTAPTDGVGHAVAADSQVFIRGGSNVSNLLMIRTSTGDCTVSVTYFR